MTDRYDVLVIGAGMYYAPGSLKARLCVSGSDELDVRNAPLPAAASSLTIASLIAERAEQELGVGS